MRLVKILLQAIILICLLLSSSRTVQANTFDLSDTTKFNIRFDGPVAGEHLGEGAIDTADFNGDGKLDLLIGTYKSDHNSKTESGSLYVIYNELFSGLTSTGNTIDLSDSSNYNIRFDGADAFSLLAIIGSMGDADLDFDGKPDIMVAACGDDNNGRSGSGSLYVIYNTLLDGWIGTGNNVDLGANENFNLRFDGVSADDGLFCTNNGPIDSYDINGNGREDIILKAQFTNNGAALSGSVYLVYDSVFSAYTGTGNAIDLAVSTNYNLRIDGAAASDFLSSDPVPTAEDIDGDGKLELVIASTQADNNSKNLSGSVYLFNGTLLDNYTGTGNNISLSIPTSYNLRFDGADAGDQVGFQVRLPDLNNNNRPDLVLSGIKATKNGVSQSGSVYIINDSLVNSYSGTGNNIDLGSSSNYNLRIDGPGTNAWLGDIALTAGDVDMDRKLDLIAGGPRNSAPGKTFSGMNFVFYNTLLDNYSGTGNTIDLATSSTYSLRYDGASADDRLAIFSYTPADLNGDGSNDLLFTAHQTDFNSRADSGSIYMIYNFPHTITLNSFAAKPNETFTVTGTVSALNSVTHISGVQYAADSNSPTGAWSNCVASDGGFDGITETFSCSIFPISATNHTLYFRAYDENTSYTAQSNYASSTFNLTGGPAPVNVSSFPTGCENPPLQSGAGGVLSGGETGVIVPSGAIPFSISFSSVPIPISSLNLLLGKTKLKLPENTSQIGGIYSVWFTDACNGARILTSVQKKPSIVSLNYNDFQLLVSGGGRVREGSLRLAYSSDGKHWRILPSSVVDPVNNTVSAITKVGGYYMIVSGGRGKVSTRLSSVRGVSDVKPDVILPKTIKPPVVSTPKETSNPGVVQRGMDFLKGLFR